MRGDTSTRSISRPARYDTAFGDRGRITLHWDHELAALFSWTAGPIVVNDVIVVAGATAGAGDGGVKKEATPENIRGFDVRTGKLLWTFHVVPRPGEVGVETWGEESHAYSGDLASWCCMSADEELDLVYVPLSAPTGIVYGGHRPGDNLFSDSLVAIQAKTGKRAWHFQMVHHDLWDYDTVGPATLGEITVDGRRIKAVMQPSKTAFLYVFDRATGKPVWPIDERPVPQSTVPREATSKTQPFPAKPPAFDRQGFSEDDLIDFTPELRARAKEHVKDFVLGPLFTPPIVPSTESGGKRGALIMPAGGARELAHWCVRSGDRRLLRRLAHPARHQSGRQDRGPRSDDGLCHAGARGHPRIRARARVRAGSSRHGRAPICRSTASRSSSRRTGASPPST